MDLSCLINLLPRLFSQSVIKGLGILTTKLVPVLGSFETNNNSSVGLAVELGHQ